MREAGKFPFALIAFCEKWPQFSEWMSGKACSQLSRVGLPGLQDAGRLNDLNVTSII